MKLQKIIGLLLIIQVLLFTGCMKQKILREQEQLQINNFIADLGLYFEQTPNGVYYHIDSLGKGKCVAPDETVLLVYTGYNLDDNKKIFAKNDSLYVRVNNPLLLEGWREIFLMFPRGTSGKAIFPYYDAYNSKQVTNIPPYSTLYFEFHFE